MVQYSKASFRGVEFHIDEHDVTGGRRVQNHEYPNRDENYAEDLGRVTPTFSFTAFLIGAKYKEQLDALIDACNKPGTGKLVHPGYGTKNVICTNITPKISSKQGGMATVELTFINAGSKAVPVTSIDLGGLLSSAANALISSASLSFAENWTLSNGVAGLLGLINGIADAASSAIDYLSAGIGYVEGMTSDIMETTNKLVDVASKVVQLKTKAKALLSLPTAIASNLCIVYNAISSLAGKSAQSFKTVQNLAKQSNKSEKASTANADAIAEKRCMQQIEQLTKQIIVAEEANALLQIEFENSEEANSVLESFLADAEEIELYEDIEPTTEVMTAIRDLREIVIRYMNELVLKLPQTRTITLAEETPSLVLAHDLYEDLDRADEIEKKNKIAFPAFCPANKQLKVLTE